MWRKAPRRRFRGIGAALSTTLAGVIVAHAGYHAAFLALALVAALAALLFLVAMPETMPLETPDDARPRTLATAGNARC